MKAIEKFTVSKYAIVYLSVATLIGAGVLHFYNAELFSYSRTIPSVLTYIVLMFAECFLLVRFLSKQLNQLTESEILNSILLIALFSLVSITSGAISGFVWWMAGGNADASLITAIQGGGIFGLVVVLIVLFGSNI